MRTAVALFVLAMPALAQTPVEMPRVEPPSLAASTPSTYPGLVNVVAYAKDLYSGSAPDGAPGFESLRAMGIRTVISVDGALPDLAAAKAAGLAYIHLPIGYNGMDRERTLEIAKAVKLAKGPVYIHCHHGKHRAAGAAGAAAVTLGLISHEQATQKLHISGTAPNYTGLYRCVSVALVASAAELDAAPDEFPESWQPDGVVRIMVQIDEALEHLKAIEQAGWATPKDHPDLVPLAEAGRLADLFRVLGDDPQSEPRSEDFRARLAAASRTATQIEERLAVPANTELSANLKSLTQSCAECHAKYRD